MRRCVIIGGAPIGNYPRIRSKLRPDDFLIFCDSGLRHLEPLGVQPDLIVGDFDSAQNPHMAVETIELPTVKDDTDTVFAVKTALQRGFTDFLLVGVVGARLDHTLGNVYILVMLNHRGCTGAIDDDYSTMSLVSREPVSIPDTCSFFSLLNIDGSAHGVTIQHAKYLLDNAEIPPEYQYGVSNEVLPGETAVVSLREGILLLIQVDRPPEGQRV